MTYRIVFVILSLLVVNSPAQTISDQAKNQIASLLQEKAARTPAQRKINSSLLHAAKMVRGQAITPLIPSSPTALALANPDTNGAVEIEIRARVTNALLDFISQLGGLVINSHPQWQSVRARLPLGALDQLGARPEVAQISPADRFINNRNSNGRGAFSGVPGTRLRSPEPFGLARLFQSFGSLFFIGPDTPGDIAHRANLVRSQLGFNGAGIKVGVLSDGVTSLATEQAAGRPPTITVLPGQGGTGPGPCPGANCPDEGTAMLEIVYTLAPGAQLYFATAQPNAAQMATNILNLANAGCSIIVDDVTYFNEGIYQDGPIAQAVNTVTGQGVFYFSSAGNSGNFDSNRSGTWEGDFVNSGVTIPAIPENGSVHSFSGSSTNTLTGQSSPGLVLLKWSDPLGGSSNDYDLFFLNSAGTAVIGASTSAQTGTQDPIEAVATKSGGTTLIPVGSLIVILNYQNAAQVRALHLDTERGRLSIGTAGATFGHNAATSAITLAAIDVAQASGGPFSAEQSKPSVLTARAASSTTPTEPPSEEGSILLQVVALRCKSPITRPPTASPPDCLPLPASTPSMAPPQRPLTPQPSPRWFARPSLPSTRHSCGTPCPPPPSTSTPPVGTATPVGAFLTPSPPSSPFFRRLPQVSPSLLPSAPVPIQASLSPSSAPVVAPERTPLPPL